jgi:hypothetical protein
MSNFSTNEIKIFTKLGLADLLQQEPAMVYQAAISLVFSRYLTGPHVEALRRGYIAAFVESTVQRRTFEFEDLIEFEPKPSEQIKVHVSFKGIVEIYVPETVPSSRRRALAERLALCRLVAVTDDPSTCEDVAWEKYGEAFDLNEEKATAEWCECNIENLSGDWRICEPD